MKFYSSQMFLIYILFIFLNKRNITTSLLMIYLKCVAVHYVTGLVSLFSNSYNIREPYPPHLNTRIKV